MERSLVIIKPDGTVRRKIGALVIKSLLDKGYRIRGFKEMKVSRDLAEKHYAIHKEKPFFPWLVDFITSARVIVLIFEGENVINGIRKELGATFVQKASSNSLRGKYGIWAGINIAHASDAPDTAANEIKLWVEEGGIGESSNAEEEARSYIAKYIDSKIDCTHELRKVINEAVEKRDASETVYNKILNLLSKDALNIDKSEIQSLAKVILMTVKEEIQKVSELGGQSTT